VGPRFIVVFLIPLQDKPQVFLVKDNDAIQAFLPHTPDHPFSMSVGVRCPVWCFDYLKSLALEDLIEFTAEFAVPVVDVKNQ